MKGKKNAPLATSSSPVFAAWIQGDKKNGTPCLTCKEYPHLLEDIRQFLVLKANRKTKKSITQLRDEWLGPKGYELKSGALLTHIRNCESEYYAKVKQREKTSKEVLSERI